MRIKTALATLVTVLSLVSLAACGGNSEPFNKADVSFAQEMIPHRRQATEMAQMAKHRTDNARVLDLATRIIAAQQLEIDTMSGWLRSWNKEVPAESGVPRINHGDSSMPGMMSASQMASLRAASGLEFDQMFLSMMISHHEGGIEMAATEQAEGKYIDAVDLARKIQAEQAAEISTMKTLLKS